MKQLSLFSHCRNCYLCVFNESTWLLNCLPKIKIQQQKRKKEKGLLIPVWGGPNCESSGDAFNCDSEARGPINNFLSFDKTTRAVSRRIFVEHLKLISNVEA